MMYGSYTSDGMVQDPAHRRHGQSLPGPPPLPPVPLSMPSSAAVTAGGGGTTQPDFAGFDGESRRPRKPIHRRTVDHTSPAIRHIQTRMWQRDYRDSTVLQPTPLASIELLPPVAYEDCPASSFATKFVHVSTNKVRCSINKVVWTPQGRRLITGSQSGEFTLWNGTSFNFEMILQAHDDAIGAMIWSHNENWMVTGDEGGCIKYWQQNMNNIKATKGHKEAVRDLSFSSTDLKFCSCSDDGTVKVWDFARCQEERSLAGHGWDVKSVNWHPQKSLLVSGAKDHLVKLWDAKTGRELCTLHGHKNTVLSVRWNDNGNWVLTASKDQIIKLYDIRTLKELESYRGHQKDVTCLAWHPFHEDLFVSGSYDGNIMHWLVGHEVPQAEVTNAHENSVWDLAWHPMGHILCSGSNDHTTKFWCRNRPGDPVKDKVGSYLQGSAHDQAQPMMGGSQTAFHSAEGPITPGAFIAGGPTRGDGAIPGVGMAMPLVQSSIESGITMDASSQQPMFASMPPGLFPRGPHPPSSPYPSMMASNQPQNPMQQQMYAPQQPPPPPPPPLLPLQQPQQLQQVQILPPPPLPPPRPMAQQPPPILHGMAPGNIPSGMTSSSMVMNGQMNSMISMQGHQSQVPPGQQMPFPQQYQVPGSGGDFMNSGGMQGAGMSLTGGQPYRTNLGGLPSHPSNMMNPHGSTTYTGLPGPPLPNTAAPMPDSYPGMMDVRNMNNMGMPINMGMSMPQHPQHQQRPGQQ